MWADRLPQHLRVAVALQIVTPLDNVATLMDHMNDLVLSRQDYATSTCEQDTTYVTRSKLAAELVDIKDQLTIMLTGPDISRQKLDLKSKTNGIDSTEKVWETIIKRNSESAKNRKAEVASFRRNTDHDLGKHLK
jgi:hypothetical protein